MDKLVKVALVKFSAYLDVICQLNLKVPAALALIVENMSNKLAIKHYQYHGSNVWLGESQAVGTHLAGRDCLSLALNKAVEFKT